MLFLLAITHHLIELSDRDAPSLYILDIKRVEQSGKPFKILVACKFLNVAQDFGFFPAYFRIKDAPFTFMLLLFDVPCYFIAVH